MLRNEPYRHLDKLFIVEWVAREVFYYSLQVAAKLLFVFS